MEGDYLYHIDLTLEDNLKEKFGDVKVSSPVNKCTVVNIIVENYQRTCFILFLLSF